MNFKKLLTTILLSCVGLGFLTFTQLQVNAEKGVGIGTAKIVVDDILKAGGKYDLPPVTVINTGSEKSDYNFTVTYLEGQKEKRPPLEWFEISPSDFTLEPQETKVISISIDVPIDAESGDHFGYLEAGVKNASTSEAEEGEVTIGIAAATKLYFTVENKGFAPSVYEKAKRIYADNKYQIIAAIVFLGLLVFLLVFRRFFSLSLKRKKKNQRQPQG